MSVNDSSVSPKAGYGNIPSLSQIPIASHPFDINAIMMNIYQTVCNSAFYVHAQTLLLLSNPSRQHSKVLYRCGGQEKRKTGKLEVKRRWWVIGLRAIRRKEMGCSHQWWNQRDRPSGGEEPRLPVTLKAGRTRHIYI